MLAWATKIDAEPERGKWPEALAHGLSAERHEARVRDGSDSRTRLALRSAATLARASTLRQSSEGLSPGRCVM
jgi:hypothetical protein